MRLVRHQVLDRAAEGSFARADVVELCGPAGSGKTEFLYAAAISNVLQTPNRHVVYLDLDYKFEPYRVSYLLQHRLHGQTGGQGGGQDGSGAQPQGSSGNVEEDRRRQREKVNETFDRLHVFSCSSSLQFLATLKVLATEFVPSLYERGGTLGAIVVDNISAYWDVLQELKSSYVGSSRASKARGGVEQSLSLIEAIVHSLIELRNMCDVPIILSRRVAREEFHEVGNRQWNDFVMKRASLGCTLSRGEGVQLGRGGARRDGPSRGQRPGRSAPADTGELERMIRWVKGERGSTTFVIHASHGIM